MAKRVLRSLVQFSNPADWVPRPDGRVVYVGRAGRARDALSLALSTIPVDAPIAYLGGSVHLGETQARAHAGLVFNYRSASDFWTFGAVVRRGRTRDCRLEAILGRVSRRGRTEYRVAVSAKSGAKPLRIDLDVATFSGGLLFVATIIPRNKAAVVCRPDFAAAARRAGSTRLRMPRALRAGTRVGVTAQGRARATFSRLQWVLDTERSVTALPAGRDTGQFETRTAAQDAVVDYRYGYRHDEWSGLGVDRLRR